MTPRIIGLFGGSFDPPHLGHLALARAALAEAYVDQVWFVPVGRPVHRRLSGVADGAQRLRWVERMIEGEKNMRVWDWEVRQSAPVPAIETLRAFAQAYPQDRAVWLLGADALAGLPRWVGYPEHQRYCDLLVFARAGWARPRIEGWHEVDRASWPLCRGGGHVCYVLDARLPAISSTEVRARLSAGRDVAGLVDARLMPALRRRYGRE
ncbi:MAG: nicotinate (nicotinamide) nucleotide adenylyltransferase [Zetaproteobacteria bacterium]|nr:MAG: nicotinate (nicotinamide) nucleotide adenylyltransferase [Zetaproteobacteria bacterium]